MPTQTVAPGITRFDFDDRKGYMVRICRRGEHTNEYFADKRCGGKRKALAAAKQRYAELCEMLGPVQNATKDLLTHRNTTGKVGVHVAYTFDNRWPNCEYLAYCASWKSPEGKREKINFSWNKYGEREAWELACIARDHETKDREKVLQIRDRAKRKGKPKVKAKPKAR
ncbi:MAG: transcriptional regulator [Planctomycetaceae bacterium]